MEYPAHHFIAPLLRHSSPILVEIFCHEVLHEVLVVCQADFEGLQTLQNLLNWFFQV